MATGLNHTDQSKSMHRILEEMRGEDIVAPPTNLVGHILAAFRRKRSRSTQRTLRHATLLFDSWTKMTPIGVRGTPQERQLLFSEGALDIDLQVVQDSTSENFMLRGQILSTEPLSDGLEGIELYITDSKGIERRGLTDQLGRFHFSQLAEETYSLHTALDHHDIILDPVVVTDRWTSQREEEFRSP